MIRQSVGPFMEMQLQGLNDLQAWVVLTTGYMPALFMLVMPMMLSTIIGAAPFVGEKERQTLEALIFTPARNGEFFLGKVLAGVVPSVALAWVCLPGRSVRCCPSVWEYPWHQVQRSGWQMRV